MKPEGGGGLVFSTDPKCLWAYGSVPHYHVWIQRGDSRTPLENHKLHGLLWTPPPPHTHTWKKLEPLENVDPPPPPPPPWILAPPPPLTKNSGSAHDYDTNNKALIAFGDCIHSDHDKQPHHFPNHPKLTEFPSLYGVHVKIINRC